MSRALTIDLNFHLLLLTAKSKSLVLVLPLTYWNLMCVTLFTMEEQSLLHEMAFLLKNVYMIYLYFHSFLLKTTTAQKKKFFIKDFFSKCDKMHRKLWIWSHLPKKFLIGNFIFLCSELSGLVCSWNSLTDSFMSQDVYWIASYIINIRSVKPDHQKIHNSDIKTHFLPVTSSVSYFNYTWFCIISHLKLYKTTW